ncbi:MAG: EVE domain-containing protein [Bacteroidota bacterium]|nr:EVE domain-containing protein [Bacteroidota bacterium]MDP4233444.1 EVE domain-containing protein [Bacteroidota bacterium]MDP4242310.1 EVE domain-containing protein [Bacteroidota bacterium]MDP4287066.1 EVE domain-containing protein [Bacteroidota bacterium]
MQYWLLKSDAESYSIDDLKRDKTTAWTGVRNYQARNYMRDQMKPGDMALFYHSNMGSGSNASRPGIVGICEIASTSIPDETAFDPKDSHFDPKATEANPIWCAVEVKYVKHLKEPISIDELRKTKGLEKMVILQKGSRLSITPVTEKEWKIIEPRLR